MSILLSLLICFPLLFTVPTIARNLTLTSNDVTSLTVTWDVPDSGVWTGYTASVQEENMADQTVSGSGTRTATFTGLTSGKMYTVVVVTESGNQKSAGLRNSFYTSKSGRLHRVKLFSIQDLAI